MSDSIYSDGTYGANNPAWHTEDSAWKAARIAGILQRNAPTFTSCAEVGCGAGLVLECLEGLLPGKRYMGFDISPELQRFWDRRKRPDNYRLEDLLASDATFDLVLAIDVFEHVEDYMGFLRKLSRRAKQFVFHVPLDMHVSGLLRDQQMRTRRSVGHLHYYSLATARATLEDTGYRILDWELTRTSQETVEGVRTLTRVTNVIRRSVEAASPALAAKLLGGYSFLALCKSTD